MLQIACCGVKHLKSRREWGWEDGGGVEGSIRCRFVTLCFKQSASFCWREKGPEWFCYLEESLLITDKSISCFHDITFQN